MTSSRTIYINHSQKFIPPLPHHESIHKRPEHSQAPAVVEANVAGCANCCNMPCHPTVSSSISMALWKWLKDVEELSATTLLLHCGLRSLASNRKCLQWNLPHNRKISGSIGGFWILPLSIPPSFDHDRGTRCRAFLCQPIGVVTFLCRRRWVKPKKWIDSISSSFRSSI